MFRFAFLVAFAFVAVSAVPSSDYHTVKMVLHKTSQITEIKQKFGVEVKQVAVNNDIKVFAYVDGKVLESLKNYFEANGIKYIATPGKLPLGPAIDIKA